MVVPKGAARPKLGRHEFSPSATLTLTEDYQCYMTIYIGVTQRSVLVTSHWLRIPTWDWVFMILYNTSALTLSEGLVNGVDPLIEQKGMNSSF